MEPTNQKHLYHLLMDAMRKLESGEMTVPAAREMSNLGARMNTAAKMEQERARLKMELEQHAQKGGTDIKIREIEGKNFD